MRNGQLAHSREVGSGRQIVALQLGCWTACVWMSSPRSRARSRAMPTNSSGTRHRAAICGTVKSAWQSAAMLATMSFGWFVPVWAALGSPASIPSVPIPPASSSLVGSRVLRSLTGCPAFRMRVNRQPCGLINLPVMRAKPITTPTAAPGTRPRRARKPSAGLGRRIVRRPSFRIVVSSRRPWPGMACRRV